MIWLVFLNVYFVVVHDKECLSKLDIMDKANELVFTSVIQALSKNASEVNDTKN